VINLPERHATIPHTTAIGEGVDHRDEQPGTVVGCSGIPEAVSDAHPWPAGIPSTMTNPDSPTPDQYDTVDPQSVSVPSDLSSDGTKLVYLYLQVSGESTLEELNRSLEMKSISLLPILNALQSKELVDREDEYYLPTAA